MTCATTAAAKDATRCKLAGLVLVRQKPGSAKGVMFITIEDETGVANLVIWPQLFEKQRRLILSAGMLGVEGRCSARARWCMSSPGSSATCRLICAASARARPS